jgi:hypothetical protein
MARKPPPAVVSFTSPRGPTRAPHDSVPSELARQVEETLDDLRHDRTEDTGGFLERMRAKIAAARAAARGGKGQSR